MIGAIDSINLDEKASVSNISIENFKTLSKDANSIYELDIWVKSLESLNNFIRDLSVIKNVKEVKRVMK